jgi:E3 UFM1-protein ligase 1
MEELQALQKKLVEIQKTGGGFKLSERTVVDIIQKVIARGKIKLIHTTNGKEYVAEEKITKEIQDEVKRSQGRISKLDLVKILEVPNNIIDSKITALLSRDKSLNLIEGKLITNYYLENVCNEVNEMLKVNGCVFLSDLSTRFDLSIDFFKRFLKERVGSSIKAKLYETRLLTEDYVEAQKQRIRPVLIGSTTPLQLSYVIDNYQIDELIVEDLVRSLLDSGIVRGKFSANIFEPAIYSESQATYVKGVLTQNNFIEYAKLKNIGITKNAKEYIKDLQKKDTSFTGGIYLKEYFITSQLKNNFEYVFYDNLSKNISTNLASVFMFELQEEDIHTLLDSISIKPNVVYSLNMNLIPCGLVETFVQSISPKLKEEASKQYNSFIAKSKEKESKKKAEAESSKDKKGKSKAKTKKGRQDDDEEEETAENYIQLTPQFKKDLENQFMKSPSLDDLNDKHETIQELFEKYAMVKINQLYTQNVNEFIKSKSQNTNDPKNLMNLIENDYLEMKFTQKSLETLTKASNETNYQSSLKAVVAHICKKDLLNLFKNILTYQLIHMKSKLDLNKINDPNQRKEIINSLTDDDLREIFSTLDDCLKNKNFIPFMNKLDESSKILAVSLSIYDKKKEKVLVEKYTKEFSNSIDEKISMMGRCQKKDYIALAVDICHSGLLKRGLFVKLPYESWALGIFSNLLQEFKGQISAVSEIVSLSDDDFFGRQDEVCELIKKLLNSI